MARSKVSDLRTSPRRSTTAWSAAAARSFSRSRAGMWPAMRRLADRLDPSYKN